MIPEKILCKFDLLKQSNSHDQIHTHCPAHNGKNASLYIKQDENSGKTLFNCKAGCRTEDIVSSLGLEMSDIFANDDSCTKHIEHREYKVLKKKEYFYYDEAGIQIAKKVSYINTDGSKSFSWFRFENGEWIKGLNGISIPLYNLPSVLNATETVYIVEGEKDADTLQHMGYVSTTSPHGAGQDWDVKNYNKFFKNKEVVILSDNDDVGRNYAKRVASCISGVAKSVKFIPSENIYCELKERGDISDIVDCVGIDAAKDFLDAAVERSDFYSVARTTVATMPDFICSNGKDIFINPALLAEQIEKDNIFILVKNDECSNNRIWVYDNGKYRICSEDECKAIISSYVKSYDPGSLKISKVKETMEIIKSSSDYILASCFDEDENIINFKNGILKLDTMELMPHAHKYLSTIQINAEWSEEKLDTPVFDSYMDFLTGGNADLKKLLLQAIGVCISNVKGYRTKKCLFLVGDGNTGKSQLKLLVENIVGKNHSCALDLANLESRFGPATLVGKRVAGSADMEFANVSQLKVLKQIVGGDTIMAEEKFGAPFPFIFGGLLWFSANKMPFFGGDKGPWVYERFIIVPCNNIIPHEKRDSFILEKMIAERNGIVQQAILALKELIENGYKFSIPEVCKKELEKYKRTNSPVITFFEECCEMRSEEKPISGDDLITMTAIRRVFNSWCKDNIGKNVAASKDFENELMQHLKIDAKTLKKRNSQNRYYCFTLNQETICDYSQVINL